jgi:3-deoxy-D-manno-octulosonic-acid transferase
MLARVLPGARFLSEIPEKIDCEIVVISAVPPHAASQAASLARRLKRRTPGLKVLVALWTSEGLERVKPRLLEAGVDEVANRLPDIVAGLRLE